jgi:type 1 glutamine amidotransferase
MLDGFGNFAYTEEDVEADSAAVFEDIGDWPYDVIIFHNMSNIITQNRLDNLLSLMDSGVTVVGIHHSVANYTTWPEHRKITGVSYFLDGYNVMDGVTYPLSTFKEGEDINVHMEDPEHPVLAGIDSDFVVHGEVYKGMLFEEDNHILLSTDHPDSDGPLAWTRKCRNAKVFFIQLGHSALEFDLPIYRRIIEQGVRWTLTPDVPGCMDSASASYNPRATVHVQDSCATAVRRFSHASIGSIYITRSRAEVSVSARGKYMIHVYDLKGNLLTAEKILGPGRFLVRRPTRSGVCLLVIAGAEKQTAFRLPWF